MLRVLDLFSGIGGFSLGLERAGMETIAFCEREPFCRKVLAKHWPGVPIHDDIATLDGTQYKRTADVVCGGFPCQPFSNAGKRHGTDDDRYLWPEMLRVIREVVPRFVVGENVAGLINLELDACLSDLETLGYACGAFIVPACAVDARHRRDRVWILAEHVAYANAYGASNGGEGRAVRHGVGQRAQAERERQIVEHGFDARGETLADSNDAGRGKQRRSKPAPPQLSAAESSGDVSDAGCGRSEGPWRDECGSASPARWIPEPAVGRVADGIPGRVDRLRALGNAVVPQVVEQIGRAVMHAAEYDAAQAHRENVEQKGARKCDACL